MKTLILLFISLHFSVNIFAQFEHSKWIHHTEKADLFIDFGNNTFQLGVSGDYRPLNFSTYKIAGDTIKLMDLSGGTLCPESKREAGVYTININEGQDSIYFSLISDDCLARGEVLNGLGLALNRPALNSKIDYVFIQIDDKEIFVKSMYTPNRLKIIDESGYKISSVEESNYIPIEDLASGNYTLQVWNNNSIQYLKKFERE